MPRAAWIYLWFILLTGLCTSALALYVFDVQTGDWLTFAALAVCATLAQLAKTLFKSRETREGGTISYSPLLVFLLAGVFLLSPALFTLLVIVPHGVEWLKEYKARSGSLPAWYIQPFNMASHVIVGLASQGVYLSLASRLGLEQAVFPPIPAVIVVLLYLALNHLILGQMLILARGLTWRETGLLRLDTLMSDGIMLIMGYVFALLWAEHPLLSIPALAPLVLVQQALMVPQLKKEASIDSKTGLYNVGHFNDLFAVELKRAKRFSRPLSLIVADLDLLRNINNTYGHVAGDAVLRGIGRIIRETIRDYDIAGRFGGEEFVIAMPESGPNEARALAERIRLTVQSTSFHSQTVSEPISASLSLGIACFPDQAYEATELIHQADIAVYQAKLQGRNRVVCAAEVPHSLRLSEIRPLQGVDIGPGAPSLPQSAGGGAAHERRSPVGTSLSPPAPSRLPDTLRWYVGVVIAAGICVSLAGALVQPWPDPILLELFIVLAVLGELTEVSVYGENTFSVSVGVVFAAALVMSIPGVVVTSAAITLTHYYQNHPPWFRVPFNWAAHIVAGAVPAVVFAVLPVPHSVENLLQLSALTILTGGAYYLIETGIIGYAMALASGRSFSTRWKEQFGWLAGYYIALCGVGLILAIAYHGLGTPGLVVYGLPLLMMRYAHEQYLTQTKASARELRRLNEELSLSNRQVMTASQAIQQLNDELFITLAKISDARDPFVSSHVTQVARYATAIAEEMGLHPKRIELVRQAAFLHDIGKMGITEDVLHKPSQLTPEEYEYVKSHAVIGANLLETCPSLRHLAAFVRHHHEWWDGFGYPDGLRSDQIPLESRILSVSDAVEAMASDRPYHRANTLDEIIVELRRCSASQFDPAVVDALIRVIERERGTLVVNSTRDARPPAAKETTRAGAAA
jgi:diguanylate cyclase (GGDEF)-like protein/putative nucleotidyltransferase with HDIG domain